MRSQVHRHQTADVELLPNRTYPQTGEPGHGSQPRLTASPEARRADHVQHPLPLARLTTLPCTAPGSRTCRCHGTVRRMAPYRPIWLEVPLPGAVLLAGRFDQGFRRTICRARTSTPSSSSAPLSRARLRYRAADIPKPVVCWRPSASRYAHTHQCRSGAPRLQQRRLYRLGARGHTIPAFTCGARRLRQPWMPTWWATTTVFENGTFACRMAKDWHHAQRRGGQAAPGQGEEYWAIEPDSAGARHAVPLQGG